jgi:hypothetical protein
MRIAPVVLASPSRRPPRRKQVWLVRWLEPGVREKVSLLQSRVSRRFFPRSICFGSPQDSKEAGSIVLPLLRHRLRTACSRWVSRSNDIGDQASDLAGCCALRVFNLPNSFYLRQQSAPHAGDSAAVSVPKVFGYYCLPAAAGAGPEILRPRRIISVPQIPRGCETYLSCRG